jgi:hypothetical protein
VDAGKDYLAVLEERLAKEVPNERWEVLNMAVPGYNTAMEVETLKARGLAYEPDVVVVGFCWNDIDLPNFVRAPAEYLSLHRLFLRDFVRGRLARAELVEAPRGADGALYESDTDARARDLPRSRRVERVRRRPRRAGGARAPAPLHRDVPRLRAGRGRRAAARRAPPPRARRGGAAGLHHRGRGPGAGEWLRQRHNPRTTGRR